MGIVLVSHSRTLGEGVKELIGRLYGDVPVAIACGTPDGKLGTSMPLITEALDEMRACESVTVVVDMGSALIAADAAVAALDAHGRQRVRISTQPFLEGALEAARRLAEAEES